MWQEESKLALKAFMDGNETEAIEAVKSELHGVTNRITQTESAKQLLK